MTRPGARRRWARVSEADISTWLDRLRDPDPLRPGAVDRDDRVRHLVARLEMQLDSVRVAVRACHGPVPDALRRVSAVVDLVADLRDAVGAP